MSKHITVWQMAKAWSMPWKLLAGLLGHAPTEMQDGAYAEAHALLTDEDMEWCEETARECGMWAPSDVIAGRI